MGTSTANSLCGCTFSQHINNFARPYFWHRNKLEGEQVILRTRGKWDDGLRHLLLICELLLNDWPLRMHPKHGSPSLSLPGVYCTSWHAARYPRCHHANLPGPQGPANSPNLGESYRVSELGQADSLSVGKPYPPTVTEASRGLCSLLRGYIRNVKLHQTISAQHPHESQREEG